MLFMSKAKVQIAVFSPVRVGAEKRAISRLRAWTLGNQDERVSCSV